MKRIALLYALVAAAALGGETLPEPTGPGELVLPPIVLEVEDLGVVHVEARLPPEQDVLAPDRRFPLPEPGALAIVEPSLPSALSAGAAPAGGATSGPLAAQADLGAGSLRGLSTGVRLSLEGTPGLEASFAHDSLDGFGGNPPGSGFDLRDDRLSAAIGLTPWGADLKIDGSWNDSSRGLQRRGGSGGFTSLGVRSIDGSVSMSGRPAPWLKLAGSFGVRNDELVLAGATPDTVSELGVGPSVSATATFGRWSIGLDARYDFHTGTLIPDPFADGHRFRTDLTAGVDFGAGWQLDGAVGWHWTSEGTSAVPFVLGLSGAPLPFLTFSLRGGYQATAVDLADVLAAHAFLVPRATLRLEDTEGWFASLDMTLGAGKAVSATAGLSYGVESAMLDVLPADTTPDPVTGLYLVSQRAISRLNLSAGLRLSLAPWLTLNASLAANLPDRAWFEPAAELAVELAALEGSGRMGATLSGALRAESYGLEIPPQLDLGGFLRVSPAVRLRLDASDLLAPLAGARVDLGVFERPGLRVTGMVQVEF